MHEHRGLPVTDPSELATTGDDGDTDIDLDRLPPLAPLTEPDPDDAGDAATTLADLGDDDIDADSGQTVFLDGRAA